MGCIGETSATQGHEGIYTIVVQIQWCVIHYKKATACRHTDDLDYSFLV